MKKIRFLTGATLIAVGAVLVPTAAQAATPWPGPIINSSYRWDFDSLDAYGSTDAADTYTSQLYETGLLKFTDGGTIVTSDDWCSDPIDAPGGVTTDGDDTIITCAPYVIPVGEPGAGLTATVEIRILDSLNVARLFYTVENTTGADIVVPDVYISVQWEYSTYNGVSSSGVRGDGTNSMLFGDQDTWIITAESNAEMPSGVAWAAGCDTSFTVTGTDASDMAISTGEATTFAAGTSTYYATFLQMQTPSASTDDAMNAAINTLGESMTARYSSLSPELSVGMPAGISVEFWQGACAPADPVLPNTGLNPGDAIALGVLGVMLIATGGIAFARRRVRS